MHGTGLLLGMWLVLACQGSAQAQVSEQTDTTTRVMLRQQLAASCVSVAAAQVSILLDRAELEQIALMKPALPVAAADDDTQRQALLAGTRAQALLASTGMAHDRFGCAIVREDKESADARYLVGRLLEHGQAAIWTQAPPGFTPALEVRRVDPHCQNGPMGSAFYRVADGGALVLVLVECVR
ncbi:hypothetical protein [Xanthomonas hortorum]|uniref:hypothetical protein n=1 Tax=Xanthomonas hortorum TaxID=56454 RepID=UPI0015D5A9D1|nr:hypothetical protein [Xanthomonas hortorum]MCC4625186.1 hypothetical protein [Xanthomonas campestris pv. nigromaculans]MCC8555833.1 hypothetical protein [Xanthomonas hortorum pv. gardneri]MCE4358598.1 hypothetical protein [Xanthomonas hortorum pv. taraxaci]MCE4361936.1 hypothetical protein [Xanthomonas hortorum]NMI50194.1 hypothetical protein [Xanthomonas hortorum pv. taraxaci]